MFDKRISLDNWTKNYKTGLYESVKKIKPATLMKNRAHIQIFDKNGNIEQEAVSENVINNSINRWFTALMFQEAYSYYNMSTSGYSSFGRLIANNYTVAEDAALDCFPNMATYPTIAWANKYEDYSGADLLRGDIDKIESSFDASTGDITLIFNWSTASGNGTFQSLFFVPDYNSVDDDDIAKSFRKQTITYTPYGDCGCVVGNKMYYITSDRYVYYKNRNTPPDKPTFNNNSPTLAYDPALDTTSDTSNSGIQHDGTYFYIFNYSDDKIYKYNSSWVLQTSFDLSDATYMTSYQWAILGSNIYTFRKVDATTWNIYKFDLSGSLLNTYNIYNASYTTPTSSMSLFSDGTNLILHYNDNTLIKINTSGTIIEYIKTDITSYGSGIIFDPIFKMLYPVNNSNIYEFNLAPSAHTLLASPITKTNANTMKITYKLTLDLSSI